MTYEQAIEYINSASRLGSQLGLDRIKELLRRLGDPQESLRFIHVAGTKGKGSITSMIASALCAGGYRTGGYFSPYIVDFRERMQIDGEMISKKELASAVARVRRSAEAMVKKGTPPTVFELVTATALYWFARRGCDIVALEVGLGGRFDATNAIPAPLAAVISVIDYDHTDILGGSIGEIAFEKCGVIKPETTVISYPNQREEALRVIRERCAEEKVRLIIPDSGAVTEVSGDMTGSSFRYRGMPLRINLVGGHQISNCITALETLAAISHKGFPVPPEAVRRGFEAATAPARVEVLGRDPLIVVDGAHNPVSMRALRDTIVRYLPRDITAVVGMLADKDYAACMDIVLPCVSRVITTEPDNPRALPAAELAKTAAHYCPNITVAESREQAAELALASGAECILVFGSLYLASDMRVLLQKSD